MKFNRRSHAAQFSPTDLSGLFSWWRADVNVTVSAAALSQWAESGPGSRILVPVTTSPQYATNRARGRPGVRTVTTSSNILTTSGSYLTGNAPFTVFTVWQTGTGLAASAQFLWGWGGSAAGTGVFLQTGGTTWTVAFGSQTAIFSTTGSTQTICDVVTKAAGAINTTTSGRRNGVAVPFTSGAGNTPNLNASPLVLGARRSGDSSLANAYYYEWIAYNRALTLSETQQVEAYTKAGWAWV